VAKAREKATHRVYDMHCARALASRIMVASVSGESHVAAALQDVVTRVQNAAQKAGRPPAVRLGVHAPRFAAVSTSNEGAQVPSHVFCTQRLVAVSKTKPVEALREAYDAGHKVLGENYVQVGALLRARRWRKVPMRCCEEAQDAVWP